MGVPALFRWLTQKYPKIISNVIEEHPREIEGHHIPVDTTAPNPNGEEFDNLYLDMNNIVHPCSHPEDRPAPKSEEEMMLAIFTYTERIVNMVRPRKLLMVAIDGVAPRAKMNQQRSRRFRSAQEAAEQKEADMLKAQSSGIKDPEIKKAFDSNEITPGTPFMDTLAASLRYWIAYKLNTDSAWAKMKVIISDSTVPGEGEHKVMEFIRSQRSSPEHDPNTRHVIYGLDADLIMLGLATHEPHFRILREDVFAGQAKTKDREFDEKDSAPLKPFIWLHVSVLREYLAAELYIPSQPFRFDLERALDDWVFICFFVGNDFLPHLPSLEIRENGIDTLIAIWRDNIPLMGGYLTKDGHVSLDRAQVILDGLAKQEDAIFRRRKATEDKRDAGAKRRKLENMDQGGRDGPRGRGGDRQNGRLPRDAAPVGLPVFAPGDNTIDVKAMNHGMIVNRGVIQKANLANKSAAAIIKSQINGPSSKGDESSSTITAGLDDSLASAFGKRKAELIEGGDSTSNRNPSLPGDPTAPGDEPPPDTIRLWEEGYADRYYEQKFGVDQGDVQFRHKVGRAYVEGLAWVLLYYFQGCPSWDWYYPYHYAPFAADFVDIKDMEIFFEKGRIFRPFEQLMGVLPAASKQAIPELFHTLMTNPDSEIIDFYPKDFTVDLNGKKWAWQGVALLPFIDSERLLGAMAKRYSLMPTDMAARNTVGKDTLFVAEAHVGLYGEIAENLYSKRQGPPNFKLNPRQGLTGILEKIEDCLPHGALNFPLSDKMPNLENDRSISAYYEMPKSQHIHKSMLLRGIKFPPSTLNASDIEQINGRAARSGRAYSNLPYERDSRGHNSFNSAPAWRNNRHSQGSQNNYNGNSSYPGSPHAGWQPPSVGSGGFGRGPPPPPPGYSQLSCDNVSRPQRGPPPGDSRPDEWHRGNEQHGRGGNSSRGYDLYRERR